MANTSTDPNNNQKDLYYVAVKLFLRDGDTLLITHDIFGEWDLPGGRMRKDEFNTPFDTIVERKIREELGPDLKYELGQPHIFFRVERIEAGLNKKVRIFAIGYDAIYRGGDIKLWDVHNQMEWVDVRTFQPEKYFTGGWLTGVQEYLSATIKTTKP